jgi:hypothetical protein
MSLPTIESYKGHPNANAMRVSFGSLTVWFSYNTTVAFFSPACGLVVRENKWGPTTGKHLNMIEAQNGGTSSARVTTDEFIDLWKKHATGAVASAA